MPRRLGCVTIGFLGLHLLFAVYGGVGCGVNSAGAVSPNFGAAGSLELGGAILVVAAVIFFAGSLVPNEQSRYK